MAGCGWSWVVGVKLWLVVGDGDKIMVDRGWCWRNYAWAWVVVGSSGKNKTGRSWTWMVARFSNTHHKLLFYHPFVCWLWALVNHGTTHDHPRPTTTIPEHPRPAIFLLPLPTIGHNFITTTHDQP